MADRPTNEAATDAATAVQTAYRHIERKRRLPWQGEEEVRVAWISALEKATGFAFNAERERHDSSFNNVIIEFKAPGSFKGKTSTAKFREAMTDRLLPYIKDESERTSIPRADFIGVAIDGDHICFAQVVDNEIYAGNLLPFSVEAVGLVIAACQAQTRRAITSENLIQDFGHTSVIGLDVMRTLSEALADALKQDGQSKLQMLFQEWRTLYGQVADMSEEQADKINRVLRFGWVGPAQYDMAGRLFVIHTYNSLLIKLLAAEIVTAHGLTTRDTSPAEAMCAVMTAQELIDAIDRDIEHGNLFSGSGINGFVEEAIFSWHLDVARAPRYQKRMVKALKRLLGQMALYRTDVLVRQRDTLRDFYQDLVPETLRKSLGEFYTPDWLVQFTIEETAGGNLLDKRVLDPTCGSGSFLIEIIRRKRAAAEREGFTPKRTLDMLCKDVWGFDLNPLAVQTARVNFLMEIADLLAQAKGTSIEVPVLLADAIYSPAPNPEGDATVVEYKIGSPRAGLTILLPADLAFKRERLDRIFEAMAEHVEHDREFDVAKRSMSRTVMSKEEAVRWDEPLRRTYDRVLELHRENWNGIWFRIVRNFFWSATAGEFDVIVGNPPWVRWSRLPEAYRERVKPTCEKYDIFSKTKHHGGNELDISAMITYTTGDKWLKMGGKLGFVITQAVFQNPSSSGFRNFRINETGNLVPLRVTDLKGMKPFPDAANKTAVAVFQKTLSAPDYPVPYYVWNPKIGRTRAIGPHLTLLEVMKAVQIRQMSANPVSGGGSPWAILPHGRFEQLEPMTKVSAEPWVEGRKGITVDLNGVYFLPVLEKNTADRTVQIRSRPDAGKKDIGSPRAAYIETDWLYPLLKGASDFEACYLKPPGLYALVPNRGIRRADFEQAEEESQALPKTIRYLKNYQVLLRARSTWRARMEAAEAPSYAIYNVGQFTFAPWKVIWAEMSGRFAAAVAGDAEVPFQGRKPYVPDHKLFFVAFDDKAAAHYLCGILNSSFVVEFVDSHNVAIQVGDIFKHMRVPQFDPSADAHVELSKLVEEAHAEHDASVRAEIVEAARGAADLIMEKWIAQERTALD